MAPRSKAVIGNSSMDGRSSFNFFLTLALFCAFSILNEKYSLQSTKIGTY